MRCLVRKEMCVKNIARDEFVHRSDRKSLDTYKKRIDSADRSLKKSLSFYMFLSLTRTTEGCDTTSLTDIELLRRRAVDCRREKRFWESAFYWSKVAAGWRYSSSVLREVSENIEEMLSRDAFLEANWLLSELAEYVESSKSLLRNQARAQMRLGYYEKAKVTWQKYWNRAQQDDAFWDERVRAIRNPSKHNTMMFDEVKPINDKAIREKARICVYTAVFGGYDALPSVNFATTGVDFICFTDSPVIANGWDVRLVEPTERNAIIENRKYKMLPHQFLSEYDYTLYIDSNLMLVGDISRLVSVWLHGYDFVAWKHPERCDVYSEIEAILSSLRHPPDGLIEQYEYFSRIGMPSNNGLIEACFLWRKNDSHRVRRLMDDWWRFISNSTVNRDQPPLAYLMWKHRTRPTVLPDKFGDTRNNDFFVKVPHIKRPDSGLQFSTNGLPTEKSVLLPSNRKLVWMYREQAKNVASTVMRGSQLSEIAKRESKSDVWYVNEDAIKSVRESVVILTKGFLKKIGTWEIEILKRNNNVLCLDYVDDPEDERVVELADILIASSIKQLIHYRRAYPNMVSHMITHHVDPDIPIITPPSDRIKVGYFGELLNAKWRDELKDKVSFVITNTKTRSREWIEHLNLYNVHYAVRERRDIDGFKPFLKGFTAAHCQSPILVSIEEGDAAYYLGKDYPFVIEDESLQCVKSVMRYLSDSFQSREWFRALDIMRDVKARSSVEHIANEISLLSRF